MAARVSGPKCAARCISARASITAPQQAAGGGGGGAAAAGSVDGAEAELGRARASS